MLYNVMSGTSMAAPHVAGLAGLIWTTNSGTSAQDVVQRLESTADAIPGTGTSWQYGRINAAAAVGVGLPVASGLSVTTVRAGTPALALTVTGTDFQSGASLLWNGTAKPATVADSAHLTAAIAASDLVNPGTVDIVVKNPDGTVSSPALVLTILAPSPLITAITPASGGIGGNEMAMISGAHFQPGLTVTFGGTNATVTDVTGTMIAVTTPAHAAGQVDVTVTSPDGQRQMLGNGYTYIVIPSQRGTSGSPDGASAPNPASRPAPTPISGSAGLPSVPAPIPIHR
jgi:hypothetical protein